MAALFFNRNFIRNAYNLGNKWGVYAACMCNFNEGELGSFAYK